MIGEATELRQELRKVTMERNEARNLLRRIGQLLGGWREAIVELEDFCSERVRLKNMLAAADQIDEIAPKIQAALTMTKGVE